MQKISSISLPNAGSTDKVEQGELSIPKGMKCVGLRCKVVVPLANASGGSVTLTTAQKIAVLQHITASLGFGRSAKHKPLNVVLGDKLRRQQRRLYGSDVEGFTDTSTGLQRSLPNSATTNVTFYLVLAFGRFFKLKDPDMFGFGRSQMKSVQVDFTRVAAAPTIVSGVTVSGTISADISPDLVPCKGDPVSPGIWYEESDSANKVAMLSEGLPLEVEERTAVHASTSLTNISVKVDDLMVHDQVSPGELITETNDVPNLPSESLVTDESTILYAINKMGAELGELPTGVPTITQNVKDLSTIKLSQVFVPVLSQGDLLDFAKFVQENHRRKPLKLASTNATDAAGVPANGSFAAPSILLDSDDREWEQAPGWVLEQGKSPSLELPTSLVGTLKSRHAALKSAGDTKAAEALVAQVAAAVPGAVQSARGFKRGDTSTLQSVRRAIAA